MKNKPIIRFRGFILLIMFIFLAWSTWDLMGDPNEVASQMGFGAGYIVIALISIHKRIYFLRDKKIPKIKINKMKADFKFILNLLITVTAIFSAALYVLSEKIVIPVLASSTWLILVILIFQGICFSYIVQYIDKHNIEKILNIFTILWITLSAIFGWFSAQIAFFIFNIPMREDLFIATYGQLLFPIFFILYFDYVFDYESKNTYILTDIPKAFSKK